MYESIDMRGAITLRLQDAEGVVVHHQHKANRIVKTGRALVAQLFGGVTSGSPPSRVTHVGVGTGGQPASDDDVALRAEVGPRKPITSVVYADFDESVAGGVVKRTRASLTAVFDFNDAVSPVPLREAGVFTAVTAGVMYNRVTFEDVTKTNAFKLTVLWDIVF